MNLWPMWIRNTLRISEICVNFYKKGKKACEARFIVASRRILSWLLNGQERGRFAVRDRTLRCGIGHPHGRVNRDICCNIKEFSELPLVNYMLLRCVQISQEERCRL